MPELTRQKISFGEMRAAGVRGLLIYRSDYRCSHHTTISGDPWPDDVRLSDIEPRAAVCAGNWRVSALGVLFEFRKPVVHFGGFVNCP
jgi:hypothetical protein